MIGLHHELITYNPLVEFSRIKSVLERIGVPNTADGRRDLYTTIVSVTDPNTNNNYLLHFKQALHLEGKPVGDWKDEDIRRLHNIARLLEDWGYIEPISKLHEYDPLVKFRVLSYNESKEWNIIKKYSINYSKINRLFPNQSQGDITHG